MGSVSIFDLDKTLISQNSSVAFSVYLTQQKKISLSSMVLLFFFYLVYKCCPFLLRKLHTYAFRCVYQGCNLEELKALGEAFWERYQKDLLDKKAYRIAKAEKEKGAKLVLLSNSPDFFVKIIGRRLGFDEALGSTYSVDEKGNLLEIEELMDGAEKALYVKKLKDTKTAAFTDSISDFLLLEAVDRPCAINPCRALKKICKQKGWQVILTS